MVLTPRCITFFWGERWTQRGIGFCDLTSQKNVHYIDLLALRGMSWRVKRMWFFYSWKRLLTWGKK